MKTLALTTALALLAVPALADASDAIAHFNRSLDNSDKIVSTNLSTRSGDGHSAKAQAIFDRIAAESAEGE